MAGRVDMDTIMDESSAYQRLEVLARRTAVTILAVDGRIRVSAGHVAPVTGDGETLADAVATVYAKEWRS